MRRARLISEQRAGARPGAASAQPSFAARTSGKTRPGWERSAGGSRAGTGTGWRGSIHPRTASASKESDTMLDIQNRPADALHGARTAVTTRHAAAEPSAHDLLRFLLRSWATITACVAGAAALAIIYVLQATPIFRATAQVLIESRVPPTFREQTPERLAPLDTPEVESQLGLLRSGRIADRVVKQLDLAKDEEFLDRDKTGLPLFAWFSPNRQEGEAAQAKRSDFQDAVEKVRNDMNAWRVGLSHVIEITYDSSDPARAARIANAIAEAYIADQLEMRGDAARAGSIWLEQRIDYLRQQMNAAALRVKEFRARRDYRIPQTGAQPGTQTEARPDSGEPAVAVTLEELESQSDTYRKIYESYLQAYADSVQRQSYPVTNARVITLATPPERKNSPRGLPLLAGALVIGGMIGVGLALLRHSLRR